VEAPSGRRAAAVDDDAPLSEYFVCDMWDPYVFPFFLVAVPM